jgi:hypothetical protein
MIKINEFIISKPKIYKINISKKDNDYEFIKKRSTFFTKITKITILRFVCKEKLLI